VTYVNYTTKLIVKANEKLASITLNPKPRTRGALFFLTVVAWCLLSKTAAQ